MSTYEVVIRRTVELYYVVKADTEDDAVEVAYERGCYLCDADDDRTTGYMSGDECFVRKVSRDMARNEVFDGFGPVEESKTDQQRV
jgi:hypothetical protein